MPALIDLENIQKVYRTGDSEVHAVRSVTLSIQPGEFVAFMGPSGSGKTTMMNILGCLDRPTGGHYLLDGEDVSTLDRDERALVRNRKLGFVFQGFNLLPRATALENVEMPMLYGHRRTRRADGQARALEALTQVGLGDRSAVSNNASPLPARWSTARRCCWLTSRRAIWIAARAWRSWPFFRGSTPGGTPSSWSPMSRISPLLPAGRFT